MRICFPSTEENATLDGRLERILGNAKSYLIYDTGNEYYETVPNLLGDDPSCKLAFVFEKHNVDVVVSCELCVSCFNLFESMDIDLWKCDGSYNIRESYNKFILGGIFHRVNPDLCECPHKHEEVKVKI